MERVGSQRSTRVAVTEHPGGDDVRPFANVATVANVLALQRTAGNQRVAALLSRQPRAVLSRRLDSDFEHSGEPTAEERAICVEFAAKVSNLVDQAHLELLAGRTSEWRGPKFTAFTTLLYKPHAAALVHVGNAIEERVYALMRGMDMRARWTPQYASAMGGASFPDIVINLSDEHEALIDITSQRGHILGKAGAWTTSARYVYVAEAWYPSVLAEYLPRIRTAIEAGGLGGAELERMRAEVEEQRRARAEAREREITEAREIFNSYDSFNQFANLVFAGNKTDAAAWMREHGLGSYRGVPKRKGPRRPSPETKTRRRRQAQRRNRELKSESAQQRREAFEERQHSARATEADRRRGRAAADLTSGSEEGTETAMETELDLEPQLHDEEELAAEMETGVGEDEEAIGEEETRAAREEQMGSV